MAVSAMAADASRVMLRNSGGALPPAVAATARALTTTDLAEKMEVEVPLRMRDFVGLQARLWRGEGISDGDLAQNYLPLPEDFAATRSWLLSEGFEITREDPNRLAIFVQGTVAQLQRSFQLDMVKVTVGGTDYRAARTNPSLPEGIAGSVLGVNGLHPFLRPHSHLIKHSAVLEPSPTNANAPPYLVHEITGAYGASGLGLTGSGEKIAIIIDSVPLSSDLTTFWTTNSVSQTTARVEQVAVNGSLPTDTEAEATLDVEWAGGIAPSATVRIYCTAALTFASIDKALSQLISDLPTQPAIHQLSMSLGLGETYLIGTSEFTTESQYFATLASKKVSVFVSSGDAGSNPDKTGHNAASSPGPLQVEYESSDPSVTAVGGTNLTLNTSTGAISSETGWTGSGGGVSQVFSRPSWQTGTGVPSGTTRCVPDVSLVASDSTPGYLYFQGIAYNVSGTSWSAPTWAGFCALMNQARANLGKTPLGFLNSRLYPLSGTSNFHDITSGSNGNYSAGTGYDQVTGIGTPNMSVLSPTLVAQDPAVTSFNPTTGVIGTSVVITGTNFTGASAVQFGGASATTFTVNSATQITATVPAAAATGAVTVVGSLGSGSHSTFTVIPTMTGRSLTSNNANNQLAKVGDVITLALTASETIQTPTVTIAGRSATVTGSGASWSATITVNSTDPIGTVSFSASYSDTNGVAGTAVTTTTDGTSVKIDRTAPTLSAVHLVSNNANTSLAKSGNTLTLTFTGSETLQTPTVSLAGQSASVTNVSGNNWSAVTTVTSGTTQGAAAISVNYSDSTGNAGTTVTATTDASGVTVDTVAPTLTAVHLASNNSNTSFAKTGNTVTLTFTGSETLQTPTVTIFGAAVSPTNTSGNNWSASAMVTGTTTQGLASFSISFSDASGNAGTAVSATTDSSSVTVERTTPTLSSVHLASNNANSAYAKLSDTITLTFAASIGLQTPTVSIAGQAATATNTSGNNWSASTTVGAGTAAGAVSISVAFSDQAGNAGTAVTATTDASGVTVDKTAPTLSAVHLTSSNSNALFAKAGDVLTLSFTGSEALQTPSVTLAGRAASVANPSGNSWTATVTVAANDTQGAVSVSIAFKDLAGNAGTTVTSTSDPNPVTIDSTPPTLSPVQIASNNANTSLAKSGDVVTLAFTSGEAIQTPTVSIAGKAATVANPSGNAWTASVTVNSTTTEGVAAISIAFADLAGNAGVIVTSTTNASGVTVDHTAPQLTSVHIASNNNDASLAKTGDTVTVDFTGSEALQTPSVTLAGQAVTASNIGGNHWSASVLVSATSTQGVVTFAIGFNDLAGNAGTGVSSVTDGSSVTIDRQPPTLTVTHLDSSNGNHLFAKTGDTVTLTFTSSEPIQTPSASIAGVAATVSNVGGNNWSAAITVSSATAQGPAAISISFSDLAGNAGLNVTTTSDSSSVTIDHTIPTLTPVQLTSSNANSLYAKVGDTVTLHFTASEAIQTPTVTMAGQTVTAVNTSGNLWTASLAISGGTNQGAISVNIGFSDLAGNAGTAVTSTTDGSSVTVDRVAPTLTVVHLVSNNTNASYAKLGDTITLTFIASEAIQAPSVTLASQAVVATNVSGNQWKASLTVATDTAQGSAALAVNFSDLAGNAGDAVAATSDGSGVTVDRTPPTLSSVKLVSNNANPLFAKTGDSVTLTFTASEMIQAPTVTLGGLSVTASNSSGNAWTASINVTSSSAEGAVPFSITYSDLAGNAGAGVAATTDGSSVTVDRTAPALSAVSISSTNASSAFATVGDVITLSFTASETLVTPTVTLAGQSVTALNPTGNHWTASLTVAANSPQGVTALSVAFKDVAGNAGLTASATTDATSVTIDTVTATPTLLTPATGAQVRSPVEVIFTLPEAALANTLTVAFSDAGHNYVLTLAASQLTATTHDISFNPSSPLSAKVIGITGGTAIPDGFYTVTISYKDSLGNPASSASQTGVIVDTVAPLLTAPSDQVVEATSPNGAPVTFTPTASDLHEPVQIVSDPVSGSTFPLGDTPVNITATDPAGNQSTASFMVTVRDTTPPSVTPLAPQHLIAGPVGTAPCPDFRALLVTSDAVGVTNITQTPAPMEVLPLGMTTVTFVVSDAAHNTTQSTTTVTVAFARPANPEVITSHGMTNTVAPTTTGLPDGAVIKSFGVPALSDFRDLVSTVSMTAGKTKLAGIYWEDGAGTALLPAFQNMAAPTIGGATFKSFEDPLIAPSGGIAFVATLQGKGAVTSATAKSVWTNAFDSTLTLALRGGQSVPGLTGGEMLKSIASLSLRDGALLALVKLTHANKLAVPVTSKNDTVLLLQTAAHTATVLLRTSGAVTALPSSVIKSITVLSPASGSPGHGRWQADGAFVGKVTLMDGRVVILTIDATGAQTLLAVSGGDGPSAVAGSKWASFGLPVIGSAGKNFATEALLAKSDTVNSKDDAAIVFSADGADLEPVAREGGVAGGTSGATFASFFDPVTNDAGDITFLATLAGSGVTAANKAALFVATSSSSPSRVARLGINPPDSTGAPIVNVLWSGFVSYALPSGDGAGPVFLAKVHGTGVTAKNNLGLWAVDSTGKLRLLLRTGQTLPGKVVASMSLLNAVPGGLGATRSFNASGSVSLLATFTDKSQSLIRIDIP